MAPLTRAAELPPSPEPKMNTKPPRKVTTVMMIRNHQIVLVCLPPLRRNRSIEQSSRPPRGRDEVTWGNERGILSAPRTPHNRCGAAWGVVFWRGHVRVFRHEGVTRDAQ